MWLVAVQIIPDTIDCVYSHLPRNIPSNCDQTNILNNCKQFNVHGSVHRKLMLIIVQQDATMYS
jgi:hypothetical protein